MHRLEGRLSAAAVVCVALAAAMLSAAPARADGVLFTFDGGGDGVHWSDPANWDQQALPGLLDLVLIPEGFDVTADLQNLTTQPSLRDLTIEAGASVLVEGPPQFPLQIFQNLTVGGSLIVNGELLLHRSVGEVLVEGTVLLRDGAIVEVQLGIEPSHWFGPGEVVLGSGSLFEPPPRIELLDVESPFTDAQFVLETTVVTGPDGGAGWIGTASTSPSDAHYTIFNFGGIGTDGGTISIGGGPGLTEFVNGGFTEVQAGIVHVEAETTTNWDTMFIEGAGTIVIDDPVADGPMAFFSEGTIFIGPGATLATTPPLQSVGLLAGEGQLDGSLSSGGVVAPGASPGSLHVTGDVLLQPASTLLIEIHGNAPGISYDVLSSDGGLAVGGTLAISRGIFQPAADDVFHIAAGATRSGVFASVTGNDLGDGTALQPVYTGTGVDLVVADASTVMIAITEEIAVSDDAIVVPPVTIHVDEVIGVSDDPTVTPPVSIAITETITVGDAASATPPITIAITETVQVSDGVAVLPPVVISLTEAITVFDDPSVDPPVTIAITEAIVVGDDPSVNPPITIALTEAITVSDDVLIAGPIVISIEETIGVADAVVVAGDEPGSISVSKTASPEQLAAPGGDVTYTVVVTNTSDDDDVTITSIADDTFDLTGACAGLPALLAPTDTFECVFTRTLTGTTGDTHTNTVTVAGIDDDGIPVGGSDSATVTFVRATPGGGGPPPEPGPPPDSGPPDEPGPPGGGGGGPPDDRGPPPGRGRPGDP